MSAAKKPMMGISPPRLSNSSMVCSTASATRKDERATCHVCKNVEVTWPNKDQAIQNEGQQTSLVRS